MITILGAASISCSPRHIPFAEDPILNPPQKVVDRVSFNELYVKVLEPKCVGCHGASATVNLETVVEAGKYLARIKNSVLRTRKMPKPPFLPLAESELELVAAWVKAGGPDQPNNGDLAPALSALEPTFASIYQKIIAPRCVACHRIGGEAPRVPLNTVADLVNSPLEIVLPGNPDESGLMLVIQPGARKKMPPPGSAIGPLNSNEVDTVRVWIADGAKE